MVLMMSLMKPYLDRYGLCHLMRWSAKLAGQVMQRVMDWYRPEAICMQCGADSLVGDRLGQFNITTRVTIRPPGLREVLKLRRALRRSWQVCGVHQILWQTDACGWRWWIYNPQRGSVLDA